MFISSVYQSAPLIPSSQSIPSLAPSPLATASLFSHALPFGKQCKLILSLFFLQLPQSGSLLSRGSLALELHPSRLPLITSEEDEEEEREERREKKTKPHPLPPYEQARLPARVAPGNTVTAVANTGGAPGRRAVTASSSGPPWG